MPQIKPQDAWKGHQATVRKLGFLVLCSISAFGWSQLEQGELQQIYDDFIRECSFASVQASG